MFDSRPHGRRVPAAPQVLPSLTGFAAKQRADAQPSNYFEPPNEDPYEIAAAEVDMSQNTVLLITERQSDVESWREAARTISLRPIPCDPHDIDDALLRQEAVSVIVGGASAGGAWMRAAANAELLCRLPAIIVLDGEHEHVRIEPNQIRIWGALPKALVEGWLPSMLATAARHGAQLRRMYAFVHDYRSRLEELSQHEREVLGAVCRGVPNKKTARNQGCSLRTVENRRSRVYAHFGVVSAAQLAGHVATARAYETLLDLE